MQELKVFYDGNCKVCDWEIHQYLKMDTHKKLLAINIEDPNFKSSDFGLNPMNIKQSLHVQLKNGSIVSGIDAFIAIWKNLDSPKFKRLAQFSENPIFKPALKLGYKAFTKIRPYLPKNKTQCANNTCFISKEQT